MPYGLNPSPLAYRDIAEAFDRALANGKGIRIRCASRGAAKSLQVRAYYYRKIDRKENEKVYCEQPDHPLYGRSQYDNIIISIELINGFWYMVMTCSTPERFDSFIEDLTDEDVKLSFTTPQIPEQKITTLPPQPKMEILPPPRYPSLLKRRES